MSGVARTSHADGAVSTFSRARSATAGAAAARRAESPGFLGASCLPQASAKARAAPSLARASGRRAASAASAAAAALLVHGDAAAKARAKASRGLSPKGASLSNLGGPKGSAVGSGRVA